eukprot:TRINITY_DN2806_c0_g1_i1.p1 TRINITY_DN2806_c0_g1~~TRINITY_DN2806_c0_g1_i1.p1  ORF type:complete len:538 (+),score=65.37 TRINITY_DN2806_c0_g1_i1:98-1711(+)
MSDVFAYLVVCIFLFIVYGFRLGDRMRYGHIPGPAPKWLFGSLFDFRKKGFLMNQVKKYGTITQVFLGGRPHVLIGSPEITKTVLKSFLDRDTLGGMTTGPKERIEFEKAIISFATGEFAMRLRNSWMPAFHPSSLKKYEEIMVKHVKQLVLVVEQKMKQGEVIDINQLLKLLTLDVAGSTAFGINFDLLKGEIDADNSQNNEHDENTNKGLDPEMVQQMVQALIITFTFGQDDGTKPKKKIKRWVIPTPWFLFNLLIPELEDVWRFCQCILPSQRKVRMLESFDVGRAIGEKLVKNARQRLSQKQDDQTQNRGVNPGCFLDAMIMSQDAEDPGRLAKLADFEIAAQAWSFIVAATETTSSALSFIIYLISSNPQAEQKLLQEIDSIPEFDLEKIKNLKFLDCIIKESNRMYPPMPFITRKNDANRMIDKFLVPKNAIFLVSNFAMHYDPKYWERPEDFYPERFLSDSEFPAYFPFGGGSRMCLGQQFAYQQIKIALFMLYKKFTFRLTPGQVPLQTKDTISLSPLNGVKVTAHERT